MPAGGQRELSGNQDILQKAFELYHQAEPLCIYPRKGISRHPEAAPRQGNLGPRLLHGLGQCRLAHLSLELFLGNTKNSSHQLLEAQVPMLSVRQESSLLHRALVFQHILLPFLCSMYCCTTETILP